MAQHDAKLVDELLAAYQDTKRNYHAGQLRISEVEGGRFCEAAFRILEERTTGKFTPLSRRLDIERLMSQLSSVPQSSHPDSIRLHIPRVLRVVYDIRNSRDAAHLADSIDPNVQDATLVISCLDWVLAELVRLHHTVSPEDAQRMVQNLVRRSSPAVESFNGHLKVLKADLPASDLVLLLLYTKGPEGATTTEIRKWIRPSMRKNLARTIERLRDERSLVHSEGRTHVITATGVQEVEKRNLHAPVP